MGKPTNKRNMKRNPKSCSDRDRAQPRPRAGEEREYVWDAHKSKPNDWRWYAQNEQLLRDSASFPYSWPLGNRLNLGEYSPEINLGSLPGIMSISVLPSFGYSDDINAPINVAARNVYSFVRHANSGHANYDAPDLMLYMCAMDSLYSYLAYLKRVYGVVNTYSYTNRYFPKAAVSAMGVDFDDIQRNLADFRGYINTLAVKVGSMCVPASMSYMAKHMWLFDGIYADSPQNKAQVYMFVPEALYQYNVDSDGAGCLMPVKVYGSTASQDAWPTLRSIVDVAGPANIANRPTETLLTFSNLVEIGDLLINRILQSEDMNIMSGDILKAFTPSNVFKVTGVSEDYTVLPSYNEEVLDQIQNLSLIGTPVYNKPGTPDPNTLKFTHNVLFQDKTKGWLRFRPECSHPYNFNLVDDENPGQNAFMCDRVISFNHDDVKPENTMEATRMANIASDYHDVSEEDAANVAPAYYIRTAASEIACYAVIYTFVEMKRTGGSGITSAWQLCHTVPIYVGLTLIGTWKTTTNFAANMSEQDYNNAKTAYLSDQNQNFIALRDGYVYASLIAQRITQFNRHPAVSITLGMQSEAAESWHVEPAYGRLSGFLFDVNQYTVINSNDLEVMASTALLSMFNITQYGRSTGT